MLQKKSFGKKKMTFMHGFKIAILAILLILAKWHFWTCAWKYIHNRKKQCDIYHFAYSTEMHYDDTYLAMIITEVAYKITTIKECYFWFI